MKSRKIALTLFAGFALVIFGYFFWCINFCIPDSYTLIEGSVLRDKLPFGISCDEDIPASVGGRLTESVTSDKISSNVSLKILGLIPAGQVSVNTVKSPMLYPSGECIGLKMYVNGLLVSGFTDFETPEGVCVSPGASAGLRQGDVITAINGKKTSSVREFSKECDSGGKSCVLTVQREGEVYDVKAFPSQCTDGHMRLGIYVKNSIAGVGTMTYRTTDGFGALGHGITDSGTLVPVRSGKVYKVDIIDVTKGQKGAPGELIGAISEAQPIGNCSKNTEEGIYGILDNKNTEKNPVKAAPSSEIQKGGASILCTVGTDDLTREYQVDIVSVNHLRTNKTKSFSFKVTDNQLIAETGGIIQGMSGSPVLQNGKIVGAVTHVFVNDPTRGYGIFIENMLAEADKIK